MKIYLTKKPSPRLIYNIEELNKSIDRLNNMKTRLISFKTLDQQKDNAKETLDALISDLNAIEVNVDSTIKKCGYLGLELGKCATTDFIKKHQLLKQLREQSSLLSKHRQEKTAKAHQCLLTERSINQINSKINSLNISSIPDEFTEEICNEINPDLEIIMQETATDIDLFDIDFYSDIHFDPDLFPTIEPFELIEENASESENQ